MVCALDSRSSSLVFEGDQITGGVCGFQFETNMGPFIFSLCYFFTAVLGLGSLHLLPLFLWHMKNTQCCSVPVIPVMP